LKTAELTGAALDWAVARCEGGVGENQLLGAWYAPSTNWAQGGPIIEREGMTLNCGLHKSYAMMNVGYLVHEYGDTPLIAAMRCYVASKLGDDVEIPKELL
jgi:hypothetical protein